MRFSCCVSLVWMMASVAFAQSPLTESHEILKHDVGTWTGTMTIDTPDAAEPMKISIKETNRLIAGDLWITSDFQAGPFSGLSVAGYDAKKKKYVGTWVDSSSTHLNVMEGSYDKSTGEMTMSFEGIDPGTGETQEMKSVTSRPSNDVRKMIMYAKRGGQWVKSFEIDYQREK